MRKGYATVTPYLVCRGAAKAIKLYQDLFGATELYRLELPGGKIAHAEIQIGDSVLMIADEILEMGIKSPDTLGGSPVSLNVYVEDCDKTFDEILKRGGKSLFEVKDQFHGDRSGKLQDSFGHIWHIATVKEQIDRRQIVERFKSMMQG